MRCRRRVAITGIGMVTPLGNDMPSTWRALLAGRSGVATICSFDASGFPVHIAAEVKGFDAAEVIEDRKLLKFANRYHRFGLAAADRQSESLRSLIEDLLLVSRIESRPVRTASTDIAICDFMNELVDDFTARKTGHRLELVVDREYEPKFREMTRRLNEVAARANARIRQITDPFLAEFMRVHAWPLFGR